MLKFQRSRERTPNNHSAVTFQINVIINNDQNISKYDLFSCIGCPLSIAF
jgi:hypothetical protein